MPIQFFIPTDVQAMLDLPPTDPWQKAAIVWAWCAKGNGVPVPNYLQRGGKISFEAFSELGIPDMTYPATVGTLWKNYEYAHRVRAVPTPVKGALIVIPAELLPYPVPTWYRGPKDHPMTNPQLTHYVNPRYHQLSGGLPRHHLAVTE